VNPCLKESSNTPLQHHEAPSYFLPVSILKCNKSKKW
jgi:hypothetical protein